MNHKTAIIIGAGPAGLTAGYELLDKTNIKPVILEMTPDIGGISKTVNYKGNRIDIGGHRFFSKSDKIMKWWQDILPLQGTPSKDDIILNRKIPLSQKQGAPDPEKTDLVMLIRKRLSRILFMGSFLNYPISLNGETFKSLGLAQIIKIGISYLKARIHPIKEEKSLEDFFINRFGDKLYRVFFENYTEKVWGTSCKKISPEWGIQRIKGLSITKAVIHMVKQAIEKDSSLSQKNAETSLIEQFMYPKLGPGQLWEETAKKIESKGGRILLNHKAFRLQVKNYRIKTVEIKNNLTGEWTSLEGDYFFSTMPVKELIHSVHPKAPDEIIKIADGLVYRSIITVGILLKKLKIRNETKTKTINDIIPDNWIYIQGKNVKAGRLQIINNWSPYMVKDLNTVWIGLEYFCDEGDELWNKQDKEMSQFAIDELSRINIIEKKDVIESTVIRMPKAYPAYFGTYSGFQAIRHFTDKIENLFLTGRNGMHKYNNTDHSMLTAMAAVENIINGRKSKDNIWGINAEKEYHEEK